MENQNAQIENSENQKIENQKSAKSPKVKKEKSEKIDKINFDKIKINVSKGDKKLADKSSVLSNKEIYIGMDGLTLEEKKKFRGNIRRKLDRFVSSILGKDRSDSEKEKAIKEFLKFYKENWKIVDFKIENFSQKKNEADLKDYKNLLKFVQQTLGN